MFTSKHVLLKKTGPDGIGRYDFLKQLIIEFNTTKIFEAKKQTLANLANFAYDPINFEFMKQLHCIDVFLNQLSENSEELQQFALAGLCNISPDTESKDYIIKLNGIQLVSNYLWHNNEEIALNAITTLYFLVFPENIHLITPSILDKVNLYKSSENQRFKNLGVVFLNAVNTQNVQISEPNA